VGIEAKDWPANTIQSAMQRIPPLAQDARAGADEPLRNVELRAAEEPE
jgi:hypothetical protein